ncbi:hypothetical protein CUR86_17695 [Salinicola acroporae]|uniref:Transposase n=1 Tax=Salinicola acroporae TaxID=1541440 RepID=A0ABT6I8Q4_9GAMM|nr:hypothetical protein [Salinicola acroporae]
MASHCELSDQRWQIIQDIVSLSHNMKHPCRDYRQIFDGILWIPCSNTQCGDDGTFDRILTRLHPRLCEDGYMNLDIWMAYSTSIRATRPASGSGKKGKDR